MADLQQFAELCQRLAGTAKKLEKRAWMAEYLRELPVGEAGLAALYLTGMAFSETDTRQLNVGGASVSKVLKELTGADDHAMHTAYLRHGDLGAAAGDLLSERHPVLPSLTLGDVAGVFEQLAEARGNAAKHQLLKTLLEKAAPLEAKYLIKLMVGDMRIGVKQAQVEEAIAVSYGRELAAVRRAVMLLGDIGEVVHMAEADRLGEARMRLFHPLGFMLASPVETVAEAMARFAEEVKAERKQESGGGGQRPGSGERAEEQWIGNREEREAGEESVVAADAAVLAEAHVQDKYDGIRCQVHCGEPDASTGQPGRVALFSRSRDDMTQSFPELTEAFAQVSEPLILDGEILAWSPGEVGGAEVSTGHEDAAGRALPFSSLQTRIGRKRVTSEMRAGTPVVFMAFDLLYRGDTLLLEQPLHARRAALEEVVAAEQERTRIGAGAKLVPTGKVAGKKGQPALFAISEEPAEEKAFPRLVLAPVARLQSAEQLEQAYVDARARGNEGVMLKAAGSVYQPGRRGLAWLKLKRELATLDVVVTAAEYGNGRRAGTLSDYTFAVRDGSELKNVGKAYSGVTDAEVAWLSQWFHEHTLEDFGGWRLVEPKIVLEVTFNNMMRSDRHNSGFALRFPRIVRIREDKPPEEIDTLARVEEIYNSQPDRPVEEAPVAPAEAPAERD